jgi:type II secretory pathway pseudopilin PulG
MNMSNDAVQITDDLVKEDRSINSPVLLIASLTSGRIRRNRKGVTIVELTFAVIILIFVALAAFFTLNGSTLDSKAEATVAALEKMRDASTTVIAKGTTQADLDAFNAITAPDSAGVATVRPLLGSNWVPQRLQLSIADLCASGSISTNEKNRVAQALGTQPTAALGCGDITAFTQAGFAQGGYPTPANTGDGASPFFAKN